MLEKGVPSLATASVSAVSKPLAAVSLVLKRLLY